jgi:hypothetical protein
MVHAKFMGHILSMKTPTFLRRKTMTTTTPDMQSLAAQIVRNGQLTELLAGISKVLKDLQSDIHFRNHDFEDLGTAIERAALYAPEGDALIAAVVKHPDFWKLRLIDAASEIAQEYGLDASGLPVDPDEVDPADDGNWGLLTDQQLQVLEPMLVERGWWDAA